MGEIIKLDKKDFAILRELDYNARLPVTKLGKKVGLSPQTAKYRLDSLLGRGVIVGSVAVVNMHALGYYTYRIYLRFQKADERKTAEIRGFFMKHPRTTWVVSTSGRWDMEVVFAAKNPIQANLFLNEMKKQIGDYIRNYSVSAAMVNYHFERAYLGGKREKEGKIPLYGLEPQQEQVDELDLEILAALSESARATNQDIANDLGVSFNTVKERIAVLERKGILQAYRLFIDLGKIGRTYYKALITTRGFGESEEKRMLSFCMREPAVVYLVKALGEWDLEIEAEVKDEEEFRGMLARFANTFNDLILDYEILHVYKEHKLSYFPLAPAKVSSPG